MDRCVGVAFYVRWHHSAPGGRKNPSTFPGGKTMYNRLLAARDARRNEAGFTLIELLIVIVILGVLAAIVVFSVRGITDRGATAACKANVSSINTAVEAYYA